MAIKKQLARSHIAMVLIPVLAAGALLVLGLGLTLVLLDRVYLPRLGVSLEEQQRQQQRRQELIVGMSHDLKSPMTSIRAYTEDLLDGVARDEDARSRYLRTIQAKERDMEGMVDRALLARVTANLLDNSRKYGGRENVRVAISARAAGEQAELAFTDNGPGVPPEQLPRLFDPFYRGDAAHPKLLQTVWGVGYRLGRTAR